MRAFFFTLLIALSGATFSPVVADIAKPATVSDTLDLMLERLLPAFPDAYIDPINQNIVMGADTDAVMNPDNLHSVLRNIDNGADREASLDGFITTMITAFSTDPIEGAIPLDIIYPVVRHESFAEGIASVKLHFEPFMGDMILVYAIDYPDYVAYVNDDSFEGGLDIDDMRAAAVENLQTKIDIAAVEQNGAFFFLTADGFYESSMVLDAALWDNIAEQMGEEIAMIVPARDTVIFTFASNVEAVETLNLIRDDIIKDGAHPLSSLTYIWRDGAWLVQN